MTPREPPAPDFRALFEAAPGLYLVLTPDLVIVGASEAYLAATMTRREQIVGRRLFDVFPDNPDDPSATGVANLAASLERVLREKRPDALAVQKYDIRRPDAAGGEFEVRYWSPLNSPVVGPDGEVAYVIHRVEDVTEFLRLRERETLAGALAEQLKTRADRMEAEIFQRAQEIQDANRQLRELQGQLEERVRARTAELQLANDQLQREMAERQRAEVALRRSEDQLRQAQKLEAVGRLAGGIAHDFNNLLTIILGYSLQLLDDMEPHAVGRDDVQQIARAGERAAALTRQLLAFSRQQVLDPQALDLGQVVAGMQVMMQRALGEGIAIRVLSEAQGASVLADRGQIEQVLMNLALNARDAMPSGGRLTIELSLLELADPIACGDLGIQPGSYVQLVVRDTGVGMDAATQARAFEPFFTTKERDKGTGLGLSTVFGIVKQSRGAVWLYSEEGLGTSFNICLPRVQSEAASPPWPAPGGAPGGAGEAVVLAEDSEPVRDVVASMLRRGGYHVLACRTPGEALRTCEQHPGRIDLLITDVVMPQLDGRRLAERARAARPGLRVLFMSGYTDDVVLQHGVLDSGTPFLQKPVTRDALLRKVRELLDAPAP